MKNQIKDIKKEYDGIQKQLASPEVVSDSRKLAELGKRQAELAETVAVIGQFQKVEAEMKENAEIINSKDDAEVRQMAMEENVKLAKEKEILEKELEKLLI